MSVPSPRNRQVVGRWWASNRDERGRDLFGLCKYLRTAEGQQKRREEDRHHMRLYGNYDVSGAATPRERAIESLVARRGSNRQRYNLVQSGVNTAASVIAQQRPRPMFLTTGGDFGMQRKARLRTRAIEGQFYDLGAYDMGPMVFIDGTVPGTGLVYGYLDPRTGRPALERVLPLEVLVDHDEGISASPRSIYRIYMVARDVLQALYPNKKELLATSEGPDQQAIEDLSLTRDTKADHVLLCEGWHLSSTKDSKDGRHVLATSNCTLVDEEYKSRRLPFAVYRWQQRQVGFWGCGLVETGRDAQWRINRLIQRSERQNDRAGGVYLLVEGNSKVRHEAITTTDAEIIRYFGTRPEWMVGPGATAAVSQEILDIREQWFSEQGISSMLAEGKKPAGLNSGAAQRVHDDIQSRRHVMNARAFEAFYMDLADLLIELNDQASELDPEYCVDAIESRGRSTYVRKIPWKELKADEGDFRLRMFPTSALPTTPAGKMDTVQEWIGTGFISRPFAMSLLDFPDIDAAARVELADLDFAMWQVEQILEGEEVFADEYSNLKMCADIARRARLQAAIDGAPEEILQALADHSEECLKMSQEGEAALAAARQPPQQPQPALPMSADPAAQAQAALPAAPMGGQPMVNA